MSIPRPPTLSNSSPHDAGLGAGTDADPYVPEFAPRGRPVSLTNRSGTIQTGGTAQNLVAANAARTALRVANRSSGNLTVHDAGAASATAGILVAPGQVYEWPAESVPSGAVSIWGATTGQAFYAVEG